MDTSATHSIVKAMDTLRFFLSSCKRACGPALLPGLLLTLLLPAQLAADVVEKNAKSAQWLDQGMDLPDIRHLLNRTGFGVTVEQIGAYKTLTRRQAIDRIVDGLDTQPHVPMPSWVDQPAPRFWTRGALDRVARRQFDQARDREVDTLRQWWISNMLQTPSPQTERLTLFWHDHFATSYNGLDRRSVLLARQHRTFRQYGTGSYRTLLKQMIRDPALIWYLDNRNSRKSAPNENLARELLELFTLGEGNYDENTVKEAARALTGYSISLTNNLSFQFTSYRHDKRRKTLFGVTGKHDGDALVDLILEQPSAATHLVTRFWHAYVSDQPPGAAMVEQLASEFRASDYNLTSLYRSILESDAFWSHKNRLALIKSPATLLVGTARTLDYPKQRWVQLPSLHALAGMDLFAPPNVSGWSEGTAYVAPGRLLNRQLALQTLVENSPGDGSRTGSSNTAAMNAMSNNAMNSEAGMSTSAQAADPGNMGMDTAAPADANRARLRVRLAAQNYRGSARFGVTLKKHKQVLWESTPTIVEQGLDTGVFGNINGRSLLPWQTFAFDVPDNILDETNTVSVAFLNDAAGKDGDRNLYVEGVQFRDQWLASGSGTQSSDCVPRRKLDAGNLYCQGDVAIPVSRTAASNGAAGNEADFTASSVSVLWSSNGRKKKTASIALENFKTPQRDYHTFTVQYNAFADGRLELRVNSFGCWPDCLQQWPECAWIDDMAPEDRTIAVPLVTAGNDPLRCHYESLDPADKVLVDVLWNSAAELVSLAKKRSYRERHMNNLSAWMQLLDDYKHDLRNARGGKTDIVVNVSNDETPAYSLPESIPAPPVVLPGIAALERVAGSHGLSLSELLVSGANVRDIPGLQMPAGLSATETLQQILTHPVYQVY